MDDLISRQAAIFLLEHEIELSNRALDFMELVGTEREKFSWGLGLLESISEDIKQLPSAEPRWIPASERLPEEPFGCIVSYHGFMLTPHGEREYDAIYPETLGYDGSGWNNSEGECVDNMIDVTAWMPLPECYRGEKDGE